MKITIDDIIVEEAARIRKQDGDIGPLQNSIAEVGLINPVLVDENNRLLAGYRRLVACRNLGWAEIEATVVEVSDDPMKMLELEVAENLHRQDFTPEEVLAAEQKRQEIIESQRKKSVFERFWLWLKKIFGTGSSEPEAKPGEENAEEQVFQEKPEEEMVEQPVFQEKPEEEMVEQPVFQGKPEEVPDAVTGKKDKDTITIFRTSGKHSP